ncbi:MAG: hypothetical protein ABIH37_01820 [archaeon]
MEKRKNKKAVSLMLSYVILISIAIAMAATIFVWLKVAVNPETIPDCGEGTSILINDYDCKIGSFTLTLKNNGRFIIDGFSLQVGDNPMRQPIIHLLPDDPNEITTDGHFLFTPPLEPGQEFDAVFSNVMDSGSGRKIVDFNQIVNIKVQPFVFHEKDGVKKDKIFCTVGVISQTLEDCYIKSG